MKPAAPDIIRDEHLAIAAVLFALRHAVRQARANPAAADFTLLHAILDYIVAYPDRWHHPKEDNFLFAALRGRSTEADKLIAIVTREHHEGYPMVAAMQTLLDDFEAGTNSDAFFDAAEEYVKFEWAHMRREEDRLLPLAEALIPAEEWQKIDQAFLVNDNPLSGFRPKDEGAALYRRIIELSPSAR
jgi:hemerythrin-like domain-containing protein